MKLTLIPSSIGGGPEHQSLSSCLINDTVAVDAGCLGFWGSPQEQARVRHVVLSHTHMDHLARRPAGIFVENAYGEGRVRNHRPRQPGRAGLLPGKTPCSNEKVWPDFIALSRSERPFLRLAPLEAGETIELDGLRVTSVAIDHVVPTVGFLISDAHSAIAFISDTGPTDEIWKQVNALPNLKAVFVETTFPDELGWLADLSKHLTPATLAREAAKLTRPTRLIIIHLKARYKEQVIAQLHALGLAGLEIGQTGATYTF